MQELTRRSLYLIVVISVLLALLMSIGRLSSLQAETIQIIANAELEPHGMRISGLETGWRSTNPILEIEQFDFPSGTAREIEIEIAVFESLIRNQFVAHRFFVDHIEVDFEIDESETELDVLKLITDIQSSIEWIRHSDELQVTATATVRRDGKQQQWNIGVEALNQGGMHRFRVSLAHADSDGAGTAVFSADAVDTLLDIRTGDYQMTLHVDQLPVNLPLLSGSPYLPEFSFSGSAEWEQRDSHVQGHMNVELATLDPKRLAANVRATLKQDDADPARFRITTPTIVTNDQKTELNDWVLAIGPDSLFGSTHNLRVHELMPAMIEVVRDNEIQRQLLSELALRGTLERFEFVVDPLGFHWYADVNNIASNSHLRIPDTQFIDGAMYGNTGQVAIEAENSHGRLFLDSYFDTPWEFTAANGLIVIDVRDRQFGLHVHDFGIHIAETERNSSSHDQLDVASLLERTDDTIQLNELIREPITATIRGGIRQALVESPNYRTAFTIESANTLLPSHQASAYIPRAIFDKLIKWRNEYLKTASFFGTKVLYMKYRDDLVEENQRELLLRGHFTNGTITYKPGWPALTNVGGEWLVTKEKVFVNADRATVLNTEFRTIAATFPFDVNDSFSVSFDATAKTQDLFDFVQATVIKNWLPAISPSWEGGGLVTLTARLQFPYRRTTVEANQAAAMVGEHQVDFQLHDTTLLMRDLNVELYELNGSATWRSPHDVQATIERGLLFDESLRGEVVTTHDEDRATVELHFSSQVDTETALNLAELSDMNIGSGSTAFDAVMYFYPATHEPSELFISSDLVGIVLDLPMPLAKGADESIMSAMQFTLGDDRTEVTMQSRDINGWLMLTGTPRSINSGAIAIGQNTPVPQRLDNQFHLSGALDNWTFRLSDSDGFSLPITFSDLRVEKLVALDQPFLDARINGTFEENSYEVTIESDTFDGTLTKRLDDSHTQILVSKLLWVYEPDESNPDPLDVSVMDWLIPAKVSIDELQVSSDGEPNKSWGSWDLTITPVEHGIEISDFTGEIHGLQIEALEPMQWRRATNVSTFNGTLSGGNMGAILQAWGYDASVESENFDLNAEVSWPGSPLAIEIENLTGQLKANATNGRILNIDQGGDVMRLVSLLNFSKIINRLTLDFRDVTKSGLHYDTVSLDVLMDSGLLTFNKPLHIDGPSARIRIGGLVNTQSGEIHSDLSVTIPLHKGLQTYAAYLAATNPPATIGLLLGTLLISQPIKALLTAKYSITGNVDNPVLTRMDLSSSQTTQASSK